MCGKGCVRKCTPIRTAKTPIISRLNSYRAILYKHRLFLERLHGRMWHQQMTTDDFRLSCEHAECQRGIYFTGMEQSNGGITTIKSKRCLQFDRFIRRLRWKNKSILPLCLYFINPEVSHVKDKSSQKIRRLYLQTAGINGDKFQMNLHPGTGHEGPQGAADVQLYCFLNLGAR